MAATDPFRPVNLAVKSSPNTMKVRFLSLGFVLLLAFAAFDSPASETKPFIQFVDDSEIPGDELETFLKKRPIGNYRVVRIDTDALRQMLRDTFPSQDDSKTHKISLTLVDGTSVEVVLKGGGESHSGWQTGFATFLGSVTGDEYSTVQCVISPDGSADLVIRTAGQRYKLEKTAVLPFHVYWSLDREFRKKID